MPSSAGDFCEMFFSSLESTEGDEYRTPAGSQVRWVAIITESIYVNDDQQVAMC